jgi:hypothetical protein
MTDKAATAIKHFFMCCYLLDEKCAHSNEPGLLFQLTGTVFNNS